MCDAHLVHVVCCFDLHQPFFYSNFLPWTWVKSLELVRGLLLLQGVNPIVYKALIRRSQGCEIILPIFLV
eukprot:UN04060